MSNTTIHQKVITFLSILGVMLGVTTLSMGAVRSSAYSAAPPTVLEVSPNELPNATNMYITVTGDNFVPTPTLTLGTVPLREVTFVDTQTLTALVPWGLSPGSYTLTVINPDGQSGAKENAILVYQEGNDWETNGPYGGFTEAVFIDPQNSTKVYASAGGTGLFVSSDAAEHWQPAYLGTMLTELVFEYYNGEPRLYLGANEGLMHSADDGLTWQRFVPGEVDSWTGVYDFYPAWNPLEPHAVYLGVSGRAHTGTDGGGLFKYSYLTGEWTRPYPNDLPVTSVAFSPADPDRIYFGSREGQFYASSDGGITWTDPVTVSNFIRHIVVDPFPNSLGEHNIYIATNGHAFSSQDGGLTFQVIGNLPYPDAMVNSITIHPTIPGIIWIAAGRYRYFTTDNSQSWLPAMPEDIPYVWDFALSPAPDAPNDPARTTVYAATDGGYTKARTAVRPGGHPIKVWRV